MKGVVETHACVLHPEGAVDEDFCRVTSRQALKNLDSNKGCSASRCWSKWRFCGACLLDGTSPIRTLKALVCPVHGRVGDTRPEELRRKFRPKPVARVVLRPKPKPASRPVPEPERQSSLTPREEAEIARQDPTRIAEALDAKEKAESQAPTEMPEAVPQAQDEVLERVSSIFLQYRLAVIWDVALSMKLNEPEIPITLNSVAARACKRLGVAEGTAYSLISSNLTPKDRDELGMVLERRKKRPVKTRRTPEHSIAWSEFFDLERFGHDFREVCKRASLDNPREKLSASWEDVAEQFRVASERSPNGWSDLLDPMKVSDAIDIMLTQVRKSEEETALYFGRTVVWVKDTHHLQALIPQASSFMGPRAPGRWRLGVSHARYFSRDHPDRQLDRVSSFLFGRLRGNYRRRK